MGRERIAAAPGLLEGVSPLLHQVDGEGRLRGVGVPFQGNVVEADGAVHQRILQQRRSSQGRPSGEGTDLTATRRRPLSSRRKEGRQGSLSVSEELRSQPRMGVTLP
jgi:hypothetical protein